ncbi:hypothetical protein HK104_003101 [Borealophlyctis nickersoniae]|nr:hypothetical protein HK104_003101 [Borealophlyctis nickersoniae]
MYLHILYGLGIESDLGTREAFVHGDHLPAIALCMYAGTRCLCDAVTTEVLLSLQKKQKDFKDPNNLQPYVETGVLTRTLLGLKDPVPLKEGYGLTAEEFAREQQEKKAAKKSGVVVPTKMKGKGGKGKQGGLVEEGSDNAVEVLAGGEDVDAPPPEQPKKKRGRPPRAENKTSQVQFVEDDEEKPPSAGCRKQKTAAGGPPKELEEEKRAEKREQERREKAMRRTFGHTLPSPDPPSPTTSPGSKDPHGLLTEEGFIHGDTTSSNEDEDEDSRPPSKRTCTQCTAAVAEDAGTGTPQDPEWEAIKKRAAPGRRAAEKAEGVLGQKKKAPRKSAPKKTAPTKSAPKKKK